MKPRMVEWLWGLGLIALGGVLLAQSLGWIGEIQDMTWVIVMAAASVLFFATYFIQGRKELGWLFPAFILAGTATTAYLAISGVDESWVATPLLASIAMPFLAMFLMDRKNWGVLIPAWVMLVISAITLLADIAPGEVIGALVLFSIGIPFLVAFALNRRNWWALIPGFVMIAIGFIPLLSSQRASELIGAYVLAAIALPFFVTYFWSKDNWWALIPAGVMASIALMVGLLTTGVIRESRFGVANGILFLGMAVTFAFLWLRRSAHPTAWAAWPAIGLAIVGVSAFLFSGAVDYIGPVMIILAGVLVLYFTLRPRKAA